jgi:hypothetical protein
LVPAGTTQAELAGVFNTEQGVDMKRVTLELQARTSRENAMQIAARLGERCLMAWHKAHHELLGLLVYGQDDES